MDGFSARLRKLRKENDITQAQLASQVGVEPSAVGKYENVAHAFPRAEILVKLSEYFNVSMDYLMKGAPTVPDAENDAALSPEAAELLRIYDALDGKARLRLLNFAAELEQGRE
ncbi:MAG: helix-turn-helix domain-containing protein [Oscillospiraceae bacterium]|jgi:transcriptional regulator with XRE-family HTH domain|nr:helix-turn-helix domain-containing protein [Oscillospiraceae bacterium]